MIFYLTGPDHSGKTTLANYLVKSRKANYIHSTYNKEWDLEDYHYDIGQMAVKLNKYGQDVVLDRWCLDAVPYRFVNKENTYNPKYLWNSFLYEVGNNLIVIFCLPADEFDPDKREEMFNRDDMKIVEKEFYNMFNHIGHYTYFYKTDGANMEGFIDHIIKCQESRPVDYSWRDEFQISEVVDEKSIDYSKIPKVIAVDFDGTLVKDGFPDINVPNENINWDLIDKLKEESESGTRLILWTNRTGKALEDAVRFSNDVLGIVFDAINDNIKEVKDLGLDPRKVWFSETWDDKATKINF